ncbi:hypothetical protein A2160_00920 [Candidatus Beckwithbacteria bacterium RBG_13_42_9]|uniref:Glycosyltransferase RgtA/B/C/D-like domain-containing protein n=1 Tax=Candidatus Beckwithbacteria bacterium RBG_13_42_9 TaxID=1797457 RepID=A0A1F5E3G0_9BACT|nr:MAG: hypothetical protein A2160_00920 [Candidatus Beckwithbacteria bacterium RBG_13_42_9]
MDDHEYLGRLTNPHLIQVLSQGHPPLHAGFILLLWPFIQLTNWFRFDPIIVIKLINILLAWGCLWLFYKLIKAFFPKINPLVASVLVALTPMFWIMNVTLLTENVYIFLFLLSLFTSYVFLKTKQNRWLIVTALALGLAYLTHQLITFYLPAFSLLLLLKPKQRQLKPIVILGLVLTLGLVLANFFLAWLYTQRGFSLNQALTFTLTSKSADFAQLGTFPLNLVRSFRNWLILSLRSFTNFSMILGSLGLVFWLRRNFRQGIRLLLWLIPSFLAAQWWDGLLMGRHLLLALFPLVLLIAYLIQNRQLLLFLTFFSLCLTSFGAMMLLRQPLPADLTQKTIQSLPQNGLLLESHFLRPWISYQGKTMYVNEPGTPQNFEQEINKSLADNKLVFLTSQALSDPYGVYTGPYLHPLSLSFNQPSKLSAILKNYQLTPYATISAQLHLTIYQIKNKFPEPDFVADIVPAWQQNRLDFFDPLSQLWFLAKNFFISDKIQTM